jgi:hypothetical protein
VSLPFLFQLATGDQQGRSQPEKGCANDPSDGAHPPRVAPAFGRQPRDAPDSSRRGLSRPTPSMLAVLERTRRCRSALRPGCRRRSFWRVVLRPSGCGRRQPRHRLPSAALCALRPAQGALRACSCCMRPYRREWGTQQAGTLGKRRAPSRRRGLFESRSTGNAA